MATFGVQRFDQYRDKYEHIRMERKDGILQIVFHTSGGSFQFGTVAKLELLQAFADIGADNENRVVIMTGTGDSFSLLGEPMPPGLPDAQSQPGTTSIGRSPREWDETYWIGKKLITNLLDIEVPIIAAVNGPAMNHPEIPLLSDIVLAGDTASFYDAHFPKGIVPGDGVQLILALLLGTNRGRYMCLTGQVLSAQEALNAGVVGEVLPKQQLMARAWELAEQLNQRPLLSLRYSRVVLTIHLKRLMDEMLGHGLALEGLAMLDGTMTSR